MATIPHALYCFESLVASLNRSTPLPLDDIDTLWARYQSHPSSSTTATNDTTSSTNDASASYPLFVTWNTLGARNSRRRLRGCIGTFEAQPLQTGLREYACTACVSLSFCRTMPPHPHIDFAHSEYPTPMTSRSLTTAPPNSALHDTRFRPIGASELPTLECGVTLLTDFETTAPLEWDVGTHGVRIAFAHRGRRYGATYLPSVAEEQGWGREETLTSLVRKAGCDGVQWDEVDALRVTRYQGQVRHVRYDEWRAWRDWVDALETMS